MINIDKTTLGKRFGRAAATYSENASTQKIVAQRLSDYLLNFNDLNKVLEVGCGTGFLTGEIIRSHARSQLYINDISEGMVKVTGQMLGQQGFTNWAPLVGDAELIPFPEKLDALFSSSAFQWFNDLPIFVDKAWNSLKKGGILAFSTFGPENFKEIRELAGNTLKYYEPRELEKILRTRFNVLHSSSAIMEEYFDSPLEVLSHIRLTGVNALPARQLSISEVKKLVGSYERKYKTLGCKITLTYNPIWILAVKN